MKFKKNKHNADVKSLPLIADKGGSELTVETRADGKAGLFISTEGGIYLSRSKALKLAWAMIEELSPSVL
jgi:hypothetical protein